MASIDMGDLFMDHPIVFTGGVMAIFLFVVFGAVHLNWNLGERQYTGYIYSAEDGIAETVGHLRFSENAGMDEQPSFCVDKEDGQIIKDLAGSGKKVKVIVPAGFKIIAPWACAFPANIELMGGGNE